ncbi:hypothetical protein BKH41_01365 [Helicobacter sp. 12S02232-10]|uniref:thiamine-phosphate kinase n=1 Tax=Helicobacter sp. 12S02232-10 TaxID=1476197 RepID=UPI000BA54E37|nr:thiamine-phosphate kinase [Helicobacter sp. 12S02232-10]PAF49975.1 hypothetical protein BKH41_01365 [Helicobacter sp. 12S02232-10]
MDLEAYFIQKLLESDIVKGLGDDAVIFSRNVSLLNKAKGSCLPNDITTPVYAMDMFWEGTHFKKDWFSPKEIGRKAFLVNVSDILAMNAIPKYALLGVSLPKDISKDFIKGLLEGIREVCKKFNIKIVGGDTIGGNALGISVSMIGEGKKKILFRKGAVIGDLILHTGKIGGSYCELKRLLRGGKGNKKSRFYHPVLHTDFIAEIARFAHLGMDISDGIYAECNRLSKSNQLAFKLNHRKEVYKSGEEYEILFCIAPKDFLRTLRMAKKHRLHIECIGRVIRGKSDYPAYRWH